MNLGNVTVSRPTSRYPWAWIAHHRRQYGPNWKYAAHKYLYKKEPSK